MAGDGVGGGAAEARQRSTSRWRRGGLASYASPRLTPLLPRPLLHVTLAALALLSLLTLGYSATASDGGMLLAMTRLGMKSGEGVSIRRLLARSDLQGVAPGAKLRQGVAVPVEAQAAPAEKAPSAAATALSPPDTRRAAFVTMAAGNNAARAAVALLQSLREVDTDPSIALVVMLQRGGLGSPECRNMTYRAAAGLSLVEPIRCDSNATVAAEIVSPRYLEAFARLRAEVVVTDEIPRTPYTAPIAGGRAMSWGMSLNKLQVLNWTHFRKVVFMDSDTVFLRNVDHLLAEPSFSAAMTYSCCNARAAPSISGGLWVFEPSLELGRRAWELMVEGKPSLGIDGLPVFDGDTDLPARLHWHMSDQDIVRAMFADTDYDLRKAGALEWEWPFVHDRRHGYAPGLRHMPEFASMSEGAFAAAVSGRTRFGGSPAREGFLQDVWRAGGGGGTPVWRALDIRYDQCVGMCECLPERDLREGFFSIHFSCMPVGLHKPSWYESEEALLSEAYTYALGCTRHYWLDVFLPLLERAGVPLGAPRWKGPPVPRDNTTHDELVRGWREKLKATRGY